MADTPRVLLPVRHVTRREIRRLGPYVIAIEEWSTGETTERAMGDAEKAAYLRDRDA